MRKSFFAAAFCSAFAAVSVAAPKSVPVAEGFLDWEGLDAKNYLYGRLATPSDLRQRVVIYLVVDGAKFTNDALPDFATLPTLASLPSDHLVQWETQEMPREKIMIVSVVNTDRKLDPESFADVFKVPKDAKPTEASIYSSWKLSRSSFYKNVTIAGAEEMALDKLPYVAVYGATGTEPVYKKENWSKDDIKSVRAAVGKAVKELPEWTAPLGISDPQFFPTLKKDLAKGKPAQRLLAQLVSGIKSKNPDQAKEAQIMYDALNQYKNDLRLRIELEYKAAPARAYYDFQTLVKMFPSEKKKLQKIDLMMKQNKEVGAIGKIFEKIMLWNSDDFVCKNAGEAKKIVMELKKIRKALDALANSQDTHVQGEAMLFQSQIDSLIEIIPTKVPQK